MPSGILTREVGVMDEVHRARLRMLAEGPELSRNAKRSLVRQLDMGEAKPPVGMPYLGMPWDDETEANGLIEEDTAESSEELRWVRLTADGRHVAHLLLDLGWDWHQKWDDPDEGPLPH
jgi:hypothetical protein